MWRKAEENSLFPPNDALSYRRSLLPFLSLPLFLCPCVGCCCCCSLSYSLWPFFVRSFLLSFVRSFVRLVPLPWSKFSVLVAHRALPPKFASSFALVRCSSCHQFGALVLSPQLVCPRRRRPLGLYCVFVFMLLRVCISDSPANNSITA